MVATGSLPEFVAVLPATVPRDCVCCGRGRRAPYADGVRRAVSTAAQRRADPPPTSPSAAAVRQQVRSTDFRRRRLPPVRQRDHRPMSGVRAPVLRGRRLRPHRYRPEKRFHLVAGADCRRPCRRRSVALRQTTHLVSAAVFAGRAQGRNAQKMPSQKYTPTLSPNCLATITTLSKCKKKKVEHMIYYINYR